MPVVPLLSVLVVASAAVWPLCRWSVRSGGSPVGTGIVLSAVSLAGGLVGSLATDSVVYEPAAFFYGALGGIAWAVGFVLLTLRCLAIGPIGPTAVVSALSFAGTVVATMTVPFAPPATAALYAGLGATLLSVIVAGAARMAVKSEGAGDWSRLAVAGWGFSALASGAQFLSGRFAPGAPFGYLVAQALVALLLLAIVATSRSGTRPRLPDLVAGAGAGVLTTVLAPLSASLLADLQAVAVYPVVVAAPAATVAVLGAAAYREKLTLWGWLATASGVAALALLALPRQ
jgi:hypothetical protein